MIETIQNLCHYKCRSLLFFFPLYGFSKWVLVDFQWVSSLRLVSFRAPSLSISGFSKLVSARSVFLNPGSEKVVHVSFTDFLTNCGWRFFLYFVISLYFSFTVILFNFIHLILLSPFRLGTERLGRNIFSLFPSLYR